VVVLEELKRHGCEVVFLNHPFGETPEQQMLLQIQGVFAEYERALIQERTRRGRLFGARQGRLNGGAVPYGYRWIRKTDNGPQKIEIDETKAEVVREIFRWYIEEQKTCKAIRDALNARSTPPLRGSPRGWQFSSVYAVLTNPWYQGRAYYNRTQKADARHPKGARSFKDYRPGNGRARALRAKEDWIPMRVPAIVESEIWEQAQEQIRKNKERSPRNNKKNEYLLRSLLICGRCGRRMAGTVQKGRVYYICSARYPKDKPWSCDGKKIIGRESEDWIWGHVKSLLSDPEVLKEQYDQGRGDPAVNPREEQEEERVDRRLKALDREVQRLIDAYQAQVIELQELESRRKQAGEHRRMLEQRRRDIQRKHADRERELRLLEGLDAFCLSIRGSLQDPPFEMKQSVLRLVVERIVVEDSRVVIQHVVPTEKFRLIPEWWAVEDLNL
jgi:site-specific DNA recombinase